MCDLAVKVGRVGGGGGLCVCACVCVLPCVEVGNLVTKSPGRIF